MVITPVIGLAGPVTVVSSKVSVGVICISDNVGVNNVNALKLN